jgi:hypothetical protein
MEYTFYYLMLVLIIIGSIFELKGLYDFFLTEKWTESENER